MMKGRGGPNTVTLITRHHADSESVMAVITNDNIHSLGPGEGGTQHQAATSIICSWEQMRQQSIDFHLVANPPVRVLACLCVCVRELAPLRVNTLDSWHYLNV